MRQQKATQSFAYDDLSKDVPPMTAADLATATFAGDVLINEDLNESPPTTDVTIAIENTAAIVAKGILAIFAGSLLIAFIQVVMFVNLLLHSTEAVSKQLITTVGNPLEAVKLVGSIFSPLLAFILGFYFNTGRIGRKK